MKVRRPGVTDGIGPVRLEHHARLGPWFHWAAAEAASTAAVGAGAGVQLLYTRQAGACWFAATETAGAPGTADVVCRS